jgi:Mrp family chromosome partitioning ATPase
VTGNLLKDVMFRSFEIRLQETTLSQRVSSLEEAKTRVEERIERLPDLQRTFAQLSRDVGALEAEQSVLATSLGEAHRLLEASALPFTLVSVAEPPPHSSTSNAKIIAAATAMLILGGCWSILLASVLLDPRVRTCRELEIALGGAIPVLGAIPCGNPAALLLVEEGQSDAIVDAFRHAARQFRTLFPQKGVRVLFSSSGHGEGVSAIVLNLAVILSRWEERVLVIDAHLDLAPAPLGRLSPLKRIVAKITTLGVIREAGPDEYHLPEMLVNPKEEGLVELLESPERPIEELIVSTRVPNLFVIPRSARRGSRDLLGAEVFRRRLAEAAKLYTVVLVDAPPILTSLDAENCVLGVDQMILVTRAMGPFRFAVAAAAERMRRVGHAPSAGILAGVVPPYGPPPAEPSPS